MIISHSSRSTSPTGEFSSKLSQQTNSNNFPLTTSPQLVAMKARITAVWRDLIYREAARMTGALRQIISQTSNNNRIQLAKGFLNKFNGLLGELRKPNGLSGVDSDLHGLSTDFESLLGYWMEIFASEDITGPFIQAALNSIKTFLHSGMFTDPNSPVNRTFLHDLVFALAHSRFEPTNLETDEIVMLELVEFLAELVQITVSSTKNANYSHGSVQNDEIVGETFVFQLYDLLFALINQSRFSELLRAKAVEIIVELTAMLFSSFKRISSTVKIGPNDHRATIHFPNITKPSKPESPRLTVSKSTASPVNSDSVVNISESALEREGGSKEDGETTSSPKTTDEAMSLSPSGSYNPFADEADNELAPDAVEEVMKFRAKMAGISLDSQSSAMEEESMDFASDRLSPHCFREIVFFLIRCIDIIDTPGKKPPGSVKAAEPALTSSSTKNIPSIKTQMTAMKTILVIFTDPISNLAERKSPENITFSEREMITVLGDELLKQLLAILSLDTSSRHVPVLTQLLLVIFTNYRPFLVSQFEFFISICLTIISTKPALPNAVAKDAKDAATSLVKAIPRPALTVLKTNCLEMLAYFLNDPSVISQIFVYYECSMDYQNTLELLTKGIAAGMEKSLGNEEIISLSGEILCNFIKTIEASLSKAHNSQAEIDELKDLLDARRVKMIYAEAASLFNANPKEAFPFLQQKQLMSAEATPREIAEFLRKARGLDKKVLGEFLVKPSHIEILREFFSAFKFSESTTIDSALRQVLESFRLPGEAQQIDRIMECFSAIYYPSARATFSSQDACYVLAFSTLMLNTDLHNPQVKHKMTLPDFIRNNRGINDGKDVDEAYLTQLYTSIKTHEIVMPEEHGGEEAFASQWNEVQKRLANVTVLGADLDIQLSPLVCGIVEIVWKPIILCLIPYINQQRPTGEVISDGPLEALKGIASLFEKFQMTEALDALLGNIWSVSNLIPVFSAASGNMIPRYLARLPGFRQVVQLIVQIFRDQGEGLKSSWTNWCRLLIMLAESNLIGSEAVITQESILFASKPVSVMALLKMAHEGRQVQPAGKQSIMSSISRFFGNNNNANSSGANSTNNTNVDPTPAAGNANVDEITLAARQFVEKLPILSVLTETIPRMESNTSFYACLDSFCGHLKWNLADGAASGKKMNATMSVGLNWTDDTLIFLTEALVTVALATEIDRLAEDRVFGVVFDTLSKLALQDPIPPVRLCEHVVVGLARLSLRLGEKSKLSIERFTAYLKFWCQLNPQIQSLTLEPSLALIACSFKTVNAGAGDDFTSVWPPLFTILSTASKFEASAPYAQNLLQMISEFPFERFPKEFFTEYFDLLSGSIAACTPANYEVKVFDPWRGEVTRGQLALEALKLYENVFGSFISAGCEEWKDFLVPLESNLSRHAPLHPIKKIRQQAINLLTRLLPQIPTPSTFPVAPIIFSKILIPLLVDLRLRQPDCDEIVTRCASLICKTFLLHLDDLGVPVGQLWKEILEALLPLVLVNGPSEMLKEGVLEPCKNVLLVLHASQGFNPESDVWRVSEVMLGPLIPGWKIEIEMRLGGGATEVETEENIAKINGIESSGDEAVIETTDNNTADKIVDDNVVFDTILDNNLVDTIQNDDIIVDTIQNDDIIVDTRQSDDIIVDTRQSDNIIIDAIQNDNIIVDTIQNDDISDNIIVDTTFNNDESIVSNSAFNDNSIAKDDTFNTNDLLESFEQTDTFVSVEDDNNNNNSKGEFSGTFDV